MSLKDKLDRRRATMGGAGRTAHEDVVASLSRAELAAHAAGPGDAAPAFLLPNAEGDLVASEDLLSAGPLVLTFFRGGWCPYCEITMREMEAALPGFSSAGGGFAAVWPETGGAALATKRERGLSYEMLIDVDHELAMQFGIVFRVPALYRAVLEGGGIDLAKRHGNPGWLLPAPATFIIAPDSVIRYAFVDGDFTMRAAPDEIIRQLEALRP